MTSSDNKVMTAGGSAKSGSLSYYMLVLLALALLPAHLAANELKPETVSVWEGYVRSARMRTEGQAKAFCFLQIEEAPERLRLVQAGEISVWPGGNGNSPHIAHALIHDWSGAVFIPGATIADVFAVIRDYNHYPDVYRPAVIQANRLASPENDDRFSMLLMQKVLFVTAALQGDYETSYVQVNATRWYSVSQSTRLQAIERFGQPDMVALPPDRGPGYVWRLYSLTKYEESNGGVYIEIEALGLSRGVPAMLRWLVDPIVEHLPKDSLRVTLQKTRDAVLSRINHED